MLTVSETPLSELIPYANNAKQHTEAQIKQIAASIQEYGFNDPIAVWHDEDGHPVIVEGHGRALAAERLHMDTVPTISLDNLTDTQRRQYTLVHNQLTMTTGWDLDMLNAELDALENTWDATAYDFQPPTMEADTTYTRKIDTPIYEPQAETAPPSRNATTPPNATNYSPRSIPSTAARPLKNSCKRQRTGSSNTVTTTSPNTTATKPTPP